MDIDTFIDNILTNKFDIYSKTFEETIETAEQSMTEDCNYLDIPQIHIIPDKLEAIMMKFQNTPKEADIWDFLLSYIDSESLSDKVIQYLIDNNICITALGHMILSEKWLLKLAPVIEEALFTLAQTYYLNSSYPLIKFQKLLNQFHNNLTLFHRLLHIKPTDWEKWRWLIYYSNNFVKDTAVQNLSQDILLSEILSKTNDIDYLILQYQKHESNPYVLLGIASNFFTPDEILEKLAEISNIKYAKDIRCEALKTQKSIGKMKLSIIAKKWDRTFLIEEQKSLK